MTNKIVQVLIGFAVLAIIWFFLLPLLTGTVHTIAVIVIVILAILWLLRVGGIAD